MTKMTFKKVLQQLPVAVLLFLSGCTTPKKLNSLEPFDFLSGQRLLQHDFGWYGSDEAKNVAENVLLYQRKTGGWTKGKNYFRSYSKAEADKISDEKNRKDCTWDNNSTYTELFFLARMCSATSDEMYRNAFNKGIDLVLEAQYDNGGWPQYYPDYETKWSWDNSRWNPGGLERLITFSDNAMTGLVILLVNVSMGTNEFSFVDNIQIEQAKKAVEKGIECILKCQFNANGKLTAWPAQADEVNFSPRWGRTFEPPSLSSMESVEITRFLMWIDKPTPAMVNSVQSAIKWLDDVKIPDIIIEYSDTMTVIQRYGDHVNGNQHGRRDKFVKHSENAPPVWSRFYELHTDRPVFASRNDTVSYNLSEISLERRSGNSWYGYWPQKLLQEEYPAWCEKNNIQGILKNEHRK